VGGCVIWYDWLGGKYCCVGYPWPEGINPPCGRCPITPGPPPTPHAPQGFGIPDTLAYELVRGLYPPVVLRFIDIIPADTAAMPGELTLESIPVDLVEAGDDVPGFCPVPV